MTAVEIRVTDAPEGSITVQVRSPKDLTDSHELDGLIRKATSQIRDAYSLPSPATYVFGASL